ncbi:cation diffusion facilitator family transporter [Peptoclostridium litorale DSM 5388]|uniref:Cation diffusion facilitator family transporter n=1 Tax=Peptoclostridium litorale DSM 5388 TaxID=1121324 RepID=A0A069RB14_PEPLI|nr:cation diffusion facilitator family transporter [Peptoclostridium litorale]KDR94249.1 cation diffusion facilitator family transporter [Peptoclostridium litorale DSM 5388]SIO28112.1 cation diffusion facilitator family transporter [Peptoclostridium litorale DSM 5388]
MDERYKKANRITIISIYINIFLSVFKIAVGVLGNSNAIVADGFHSLSDVITSIGVLAGIVVAKKPRDEEHNYGHEKAETLAAFVLSLVLIYAGVKIGLGSMKLMLHPENIKTPSYIALFAAIISILIKEVQYRITVKVGRDINSKALIADAWHHRSDALSSVGTLIGVGGAIMGYGFLDPLAGIIVSLLVLKVGFEILKTSANELMDTSVDKETEYAIREISIGVYGVKNISSLRTRIHGSMAYVDIAICVDPNMSVYDAHDIAEDVQNKVRTQISIIKEVVVHIDPCRREQKHEGCLKIQDCNNPSCEEGCGKVYINKS